MGKGYQIEEIKQKLVELLQKSKSGLSGVDISDKLGINRITMIKYLRIFLAEGIVQKKNIGNVAIWSVADGIENYVFPDDYFRVQSKFLELLLENKERETLGLIRNSLFSSASVEKIVLEVIVPAILTIQKLFDDGKLGTAEQNYIKNIINRSIHILNHTTEEVDLKKNVILIAADDKSQLLSESAAAVLKSKGWTVYSLGDMSSAIDVLFDLDLQKFLTKNWKQKTGMMGIVVFSSNEEGMKFFTESINSIREKYSKNIRLALCGKTAKSESNADLANENLEIILQWLETVFGNLEN